MNISKKDLGKTLKKFKGTAWDQSPLFKKIYEEEYGQFGGEPFGCLVGDYYFDHSAAGRRAARRDVARSPPRRTRRSSPAPRPSADADGLVAGTGQSARPDQDLQDAGVRRLALAARVRGLPLPRPGDAALPVAPALRREDQPGRGVRLRGRHRRRRPQQVHLGQLGLRDGAPTSTARSSCTAGARASAASSPAARSKACPATPSRPTTAAWT